MTKRLGDILAKLTGHAEYNPVASPDGVRLINFDYARKVETGKGQFEPADPGTFMEPEQLRTNKEFADLVVKARKMLELDEDLVVDTGAFHAHTGYSSNDWSVNKNGEGYWNTISGAGRSDLQGRVRGLVRELQPRIDEIDADFAERYGWKTNSEVNDAYREGDGLSPPPAMN